MSPQPGEPPAEPHELIHPVGEEAAVVSRFVREPQVLRAVAPYGSPESAEAAGPAGTEAIIAQHRDWIACGCPGARSHDDVMNELLAPSGGWQPPASA